MFHPITLARGEGVPDVRFEVPALAPGDPRDLMLATTLVVFGEVVLGEYESGITYPAFQHGAGRVRSGATIQVSYQDGPDPRFVCRLEPV